MNTSLGRHGLIGLAIGATAGLGLIAFIIYKEVSRRRGQRLLLESRPPTRLHGPADRPALLLDTLDDQGGSSLLGTQAARHGCAQ